MQNSYSSNKEIQVQPQICNQEIIVLIKIR